MCDYSSLQTTCLLTTLSSNISKILFNKKYNYVICYDEDDNIHIVDLATKNVNQYKSENKRQAFYGTPAFLNRELIVRVSIWSGFLLRLDIRESGVKRGFLAAAQVAADIVLCDLRDFTGEGDDADQVRDHHQAVEGVRQVPGQVVAHDCAAEDQQYEEHPVGDGPLFTQQILTGLGAVMAPAQHG